MKGNFLRQILSSLLYFFSILASPSLHAEIRCSDLFSQGTEKKHIFWETLLVNTNFISHSSTSVYRGMRVTQKELENILEKGLEVSKAMNGREIYFSYGKRTPKGHSIPWYLKGRFDEYKPIGILIEVDFRDVPFERDFAGFFISTQNIPISKIKEIYIRRGNSLFSVLIPMRIHQQ